MAFCFNGSGGVAIVDVTDKSDMVQIAAFNYSQSAYTHQGWLSEDGRFLYFNDELDESNYGNGTRSTFDFGFPGLACRHCAGSENPRRFFYRTSEILSGNYSHIPNHLLACPGVPAEMKKHLKDLKKDHMTKKHALNRGAQKLFFQTIWDRLHGK